MLGHRLKADEGRFILEYDLDVDGHNELLPLSQGREHAEEFRQFADVLRLAADRDAPRAVRSPRRTYREFR
jgi:hypothetical protein